MKKIIIALIGLSVGGAVRVKATRIRKTRKEAELAEGDRIKAIANDYISEAVRDSYEFMLNETDLSFAQRQQLIGKYTTALVDLYTFI